MTTSVSWVCHAAKAASNIPSPSDDGPADLLGDSWMQVKVPYVCWNKQQSSSVQEDLLEHIHIRSHGIDFSPLGGYPLVSNVASFQQ